MAIRRSAPVQELDAAVEAAVSGSVDPIYGDLERRKRARGRSPGQRRKAERDRARNKVTYDLMPELSAVVDEIAKARSIPVSQVAHVLLVYGLKAMKRGELNFDQFSLRVSRSPRYDWTIEDLPEPPDVQKSQK